jgi:hypothetical protein
MKLPAWARADHPVARRESAVWQKIYKKWGWLLILIVLLPCGCSALCSLTALPAAFTVDTPTTALLVFLGWTLFVGVWVTSGLWAWVLGVFAGIGGSIMVARERESLNWSLLKITTLSVREILAAKLAALVRLMFWPSVAILGLETTGITLMVVGSLVGVYIAGQVAGSDLPLTFQIGLAMLLIGIWPIAVLYFVISNLSNLVYNSAVGLLTSTFTRTTGNAVALTFVVSLGLALLVFIPIQQVIGIVLQLFGGLLTLNNQSPVAFFAFSSVASFVLPLVIQIGLTALLLVWAVYQTERIVE